MPVLTMQIGKTTTEKKKELIEKLSKTAADITSIPQGSFVVFIEEYALDNIGFGGQTMVDIMANK